MFKKTKKADKEASSIKPIIGFKSLLTGNFLSKDKLVKSLPYVFYITFLGICYIANGYQAEKIIRKLFKTNNELKELRSEYITTKSDLMYISKQSQLARSTESLGLKELVSPPKKIVINKQEREAYFHE